MQSIVEFLEGKAKDAYGRYLTDIWQLESNWRNLELAHNYIQWIFPLNEPSNEPFIKQPILTEQDCEKIQQSELAQQNLLRSFEMMLNFWGLTFENGQIFPKEDLNSRTHFWLRSYNHNQLRITRVIKCLSLLGQKDLAKLFQQAVISIGREKGKIEEKRFIDWQQAIK
ncbi:hypothetical protein B0187_08385 [Haemophilus paracuniculus]|uniref:Opioid growth factor receptor (OGFr) conserved domain-containing protein n=1 Tax=Haemophilus paracuniculus TaxID=734 RepID=A0A1T0AR67_9PAST|nr:opioid growth factor receptor-related protein [Haemophilus paracuniculus]OOR98454.1 hypothetical protein B0187_08385 [Haemophilus paracuniculus]